MTNNVLKSAVVVDNYKVYYTFQKKKDSEYLNAMGNFYRFSYQQKQIQNFLESYFIKNGKPKIGDEIYFDTQPGKIEIIQIEENYIRDDLEQELHEIELKFEKLKKNKAK